METVHKIAASIGKRVEGDRLVDAGALLRGRIQVGNDPCVTLDYEDGIRLPVDGHPDKTVHMPPEGGLHIDTGGVCPPPPRPDEPRHVAAVVEDASGRSYIRVDGDAARKRPWVRSEFAPTNCLSWDEIDDEPIRVKSLGVDPDGD